MDGAREKLPAECEVTRTAGSGSRNPEMEAERWSAEVEPVIKEVDEEVLPMEEVSRQFEEVVAGKDVPSTEAEGGFCNV